MGARKERVLATVRQSNLCMVLEKGWALASFGNEDSQAGGHREEAVEPSSAALTPTPTHELGDRPALP